MARWNELVERASMNTEQPRGESHADMYGGDAIHLGSYGTEGESLNIPEQVETFYHLLGLWTGLTWSIYWQETPIQIVRWMVKSLNHKMEKGFISVHEFSGYKNLARSVGYKGFDQ